MTGVNPGNESAASAGENRPVTGNRVRSGNRFLKTVAALSMLAGWCSAGMILAAVFITCQMIFVRYVLNGSTVWQTEAVVYLMISATLTGLSFVQSERGHVNVDLVPLALGPDLRHAVFYLTMCLSIAIVAVMLFYGYEYWHLAWKKNWTSDTIWSVRLWIPYAALPIGFTLLLLQLTADLVAVVLKVEPPFGLPPKAKEQG